ncbi:MAG: hypothetical protein JSR37_09420 [Verrucomicrobia bacterium]|nr:hypothetical protein [Verrucomicrobiota bacterium]
MSLLDPVSPRMNARNLDLFLKEETALPQVALDCFQDIQQSQLGILHYAKKYFIGTATYTGTVAAPIGLTVGALWYQYGITRISLAAGSMLLFDRLAKVTTSFAPIKFVAFGATVALVYAAGKVTDAALKSFATQEKEALSFQKIRHDQIILSLTNVYNGIADELMKLYNKSEANPKSLYELKERVVTVVTQQAKAEEQMAALGLSPSETSQIMSKLSSAVQMVSETALSLQLGADAENTKLLIALSDKVSIPESIARQVEQLQNSPFSLRDFCNDEKGKKYKAVAEELASIYSGIATEIEKSVQALRPTRLKRKRTLSAQLTEALELQKKLPLIEQKITALQIPNCIANEIISPLQKALEKISNSIEPQ